MTMPTQLTALAHGLCSHLGRRAEALQFLSAVKVAGAVTQIQTDSSEGMKLGVFQKKE